MLRAARRANPHTEKERGRGRKRPRLSAQHYLSCLIPGWRSDAIIDEGRGHRRRPAVGWGLLLCVGLVYVAWPAYGNGFLQMRTSVYPWFRGARSFGGAGIGTVDGLIDGAIAGFLFAWLYNVFAARPGRERI